MAKDVHPPRGMRDFLPLEHLKRTMVLNQIRMAYAQRGFQEIETPALEDLGRLTSGQGGDNEKLAFRVMKRGAELDGALDQPKPEADTLADLGLRFDLTVPLTRYYATNRAKLPNVFKAIQAGPVWRAERPQKGRYRQFMQCDIDIIGDGTFLAEVELLIASLDALQGIGLAEANIRVNHRALLMQLIAEIGVPEDGKTAALIIIDKLDKIEAEGVTQELSEKFGAEVAKKAAKWLAEIRGETLIPFELAEIFDAVESVHPGKLRFDPTLVRGMGYYTGPIFEIEHPGSGSSIGGGGRYDGMVGRWTGQDVAAVGISIGFERAVELVSDDLMATRPKGIVLLLENRTPETLANALRLQRGFLSHGEQVRLENRVKNLKVLLDSLSAQGFNRFLAVDADSTGEVDFGALRHFGD